MQERFWEIEGLLRDALKMTTEAMVDTHIRAALHWLKLCDGDLCVDISRAPILQNAITVEQTETAK